MNPLDNGPEPAPALDRVVDGWVYPRVEIATALIAIAVGLVSYFIVSAQRAPGSAFSPSVVTLLLVANLVPLMILVTLIARRVAILFASRREGRAGSRLHVRLVALFAVIAALPTLLVVVFASMLFQFGVQFWFSERSHTVLQNADRVAQAYVEENRQRISADIQAMAGDITGYANQFGIESARFGEGLAWQVAARNLSEAAVVAPAPGGKVRLYAGANLDQRALSARLPAAIIPHVVPGKPQVMTMANDRIEALVRLDPVAEIYLYVSRRVDPRVLAAASSSRGAITEYEALSARSRALQLRFNAVLLLVSLLILAVAIWVALWLANRIVQPMGELVGAAERVGAGDLSARVVEPTDMDEVGTLARAFNRMTGQLQAQTAELVSANAQLDSRRAFTEAVLSGVTAGVLSLDGERRIRLANRSAAELLEGGERTLVGRPLAEVVPELDAMVQRGEKEALVQIARGADTQTLAVKRVGADTGHVLTFDDISEQLADQRRAAWADVARRIAHEIKNPLTPIQLSAERLQRKYGSQIADDQATFQRLTGTIVRQVGDLRRIVDEFSSFARMPKPLFRPEPIVDIARQSLFLHEVAHPGINYLLDSPEAMPLLVCDRRQIAQALTNLIKNASEAVEARQEITPGPGQVAVSIAVEGDRLTLAVVDDGCGLPAERDRLTEPYVTTRSRGTGLGLAIVKKIIEEHYGLLDFADRPGGGAAVRASFDMAQLAAHVERAALPADIDGEEQPRRKQGV